MLSCLPVSLFPELISGTSSIERWANYAAELGLDAFDISILFVRDRTPRGISQLRAQVEASGLASGDGSYLSGLYSSRQNLLGARSEESNLRYCGCH